MTENFLRLVSVVTGWVGDRSLDSGLASALTEAFPPGGELFEDLAGECKAGMKDRWLGQFGDAARRWGRVLDPGERTAGFSVDVVLLDSSKGPVHTHLTGEIDMIIPVDDGAQFDARSRGWLVYGPGTSHQPTATGGRVIILYLLPKGLISFSGAE